MKNFFKIKLASALLLTLILLFAVSCTQADDNTAKLHIIDVGQGDSALLISENTAILIDAGPNYSEEKLVAYLRDVGVKKLDAMILSHQHEDHIGGADKVLELFETAEVILPNAMSTSRSFEKILDLAEEKDILLSTVFRGDEFDIGDFKITVLSPEDKYYDELNDTSIVAKIEYGETSFMFTGDAEALVEKEILKSFDKELLDCDFLKVGHHGSSSSSTEEFVLAVSPKFATVSCGANNDYGHPHREIRQLFKRLEIELYRTDTDGSIVFKTDGQGLVPTNNMKI